MALGIDAGGLRRRPAPCASPDECAKGDLNPLRAGENTRLFGAVCVSTCRRVPSDGPLGATSTTAAMGLELTRTS